MYEFEVNFSLTVEKKGTKISFKLTAAIPDLEK